MNPDLYKSGFVQRWHTHPVLARTGQTLGHHQWGVATIIAALHPAPSAALIMSAIWHDAGEFVSGDMPYDAKRGNITLSYELGKVEDRARRKLTGSRQSLDDDDKAWLELADRLEAYLYVQVVEPRLLDSNDWIDALDNIFEMADELGIYEDIAELVE
jgi:5'-deoxynucleotidase YfbR-like HD superfamily hydrolase